MLHILFLIYLCISTFLNMIYGGSPFSLIAPSIHVYANRIRMIFKPSIQVSLPTHCYTMPKRIRLYLLMRVALKLLLYPLSDMLWLLDELLFPSYRKQSIQSPVFIVGGFRTGSTSLHRTLYSILNYTEETQQGNTTTTTSFVTSPRFVELFLPFLSLQYLFDFFERIPKGKFLIQYLQRFFLQKVLGSALTDRHPMSWYEPEEDDILLAKWHYSGWYTMFMFPDVLLQKPGTASNYCWYGDGDEMERSLLLYKRCMQKILWRRGGGDGILLCKNHFINYVPRLKKLFPNAKFIFIVRHPKYTIPSLYSLSQHALRRFALEPLSPPPLVIHAHYDFWDYYTSEELNLFYGECKEVNNTKKNDTTARKRSRWIKHSDYLNSPSLILKSIIQDFLCETVKIIKIPSKNLAPVASDGINMNEISKFSEHIMAERYKAYIETFKLQNT